jgi:flagellin-like protein
MDKYLEFYEPTRSIMDQIANLRRTDSDRAVSPVIGVILMVAITVILAAVIGAFVLEIGDQQETAPRTSFDSEQVSATLYGTAGEVNWTVVSFSHAGGDVLDVSQSEVKVSGNSSVWGFPSGIPGKGDTPSIVPTPNYLPSLGSNGPVEFSSGEQWQMFGRGGGLPSECANWRSPIPADEYVKRGSYGASGNSYAFWIGSPVESPPDPEYCRVKKQNGGYFNDIETGSDVQVVWEAESGGKTQTLFKYSVQ